MEGVTENDGVYVVNIHTDKECEEWSLTHSLPNEPRVTFTAKRDCDAGFRLYDFMKNPRLLLGGKEIEGEACDGVLIARGISAGDALELVFDMETVEKKEFFVQVQAMGEEGAPVMITQAEYMRRMKEMAAIQPGMNFYGDMADMYNVLINEEHPLIKRALSEAESVCADKLQPIDSETATLEARRKELYDARKDKKDEDIPQSEKDELNDVEQKITKAKSDKEAILAEYAAGDKHVRQLIDITLLQNNMLTGEALSNFVKRSIELMK